MTKIDRREFLLGTAGAGGLALLGCAAGPGATAASAGGTRPAPARPASRRILMLGGTGFLGPHVVEHARARGHVITLFNRGKTRPEIFPDVEKLRGDRDGDLDALRGRTWDAVVDTSGYVPRVVKASAELLAPSIGHYVFVSTLSVYADTSTPGTDEDAPIAPLPDPSSEDVQTYYGPLKARSERAVEASLPDRATSVRPGLIVGPLDPTDRFTYWPARVERGGEVLAPGTGADPVQFIDARDLAAWIVHVIEGKILGVYNAVGPAAPLTMTSFLEACRDVVGGDARFTWCPAPFLERHGIAPWSDMPVWVPAMGDGAGFSRVSARRAIARGLAFRPLAETVRDTMTWWWGLSEERRTKLRSGITADRELAVLEAWRHERGG